MFPIKRLAGFYDNASLAASICYFFSGTNAYGHLWFPLALFWIFILFSLIVMIVGKRSGVLCFLLILGLEPLYTRLAQSYPVFGIYELASGVSYLKYFAMGFYFDQYRKKFAEIPGKLAIGIAIILISLLSVYNEVQGISKLFEMPAFSLIMWFGLFCLSSALCKTKITENACYRVLINSSFYIYLFHEPLNFIWIKIARDTSLLSHSWGVIGFYAGRSVGAIILSIVLYKLYFLFLNAIKKRRLRLSEAKSN